MRWGEGDCCEVFERISLLERKRSFVENPEHGVVSRCAKKACGRIRDILEAEELFSFRYPSSHFL